jgi:hypothetical protein
VIRGRGIMAGRGVGARGGTWTYSLGHHDGADHARAQVPLRSGRDEVGHDEKRLFFFADRCLLRR